MVSRIVCIACMDFERCIVRERCNHRVCVFWRDVLRQVLRPTAFPESEFSVADARLSYLRASTFTSYAIHAGLIISLLPLVACGDGAVVIISNVFFSRCLQRRSLFAPDSNNDNAEFFCAIWQLGLGLSR